MAVAFNEGKQLSLVHNADWKPRVCVWELTLACNLRCEHCGSAAGEARADEMTTVECLRVANELADMGCEVVTLAGGEPTMREEWDVIARTLVKRGVYVNMITNGVYKNEAAGDDVARRALAAGMGNVGVSLDGPEDVHDSIRGKKTFAKAVASIKRFRAAGMRVAVLTTVSQRNLASLAAIREIAMQAGASIWRVQLAVPMGSMDEHRDQVLRPAQLLELVPELARLAKLDGVRLLVADSIGYYGPHDKVLRDYSWRNKLACWKGCQAGMQVIGIEADGGVKGCLSMQARVDGADIFREASLREQSLEEIWTNPNAFAYNRQFTPDKLTGACAACKHGTMCRGGARCVAAGDNGVLTEDRYCWTAEAAVHTPGKRLLRHSAAAAAALVMAVAPGCSDEESLPPPGDDVVEDMQAAYGVPVDIAETDVRDDLGQDMQTAYGVPWDAIEPPYSVPPDDMVEDMQTAYGVPWDAVEPPYSVPPDTVDAPDVSDTSTDLLDDMIAPAYGVPIDQ